MFKKINNIIFLVLFLAVICVPLLFTRWESGGVSEEENRNLAQFPAFFAEGQFNSSFTKEFETWFMDHMGLRRDMISVNTDLMSRVFNRDLTTSDVKTGKTGDRIYATQAVIQDFAHVNLRSEEEVGRIGQSYQTISDWVERRDAAFYYVQCVDKHTIYPERFLASVRQLGTVSKTDQVLTYLQSETKVDAIYFKQVLLDNADAYPVFSHWGDSTHWTSRGAYISYVHMMDRINEDLPAPVKVLTEQDYDVTYETYYGPDGQSEQIERLALKAAKAKMVDVAAMGQWASDRRHSVWENPEAGNDYRLLVMGDSYIDSFIIDDIAESFGQVWMVWGDYTQDLPQIVEQYDPDIVIYECAERVDRSYAVCELAQALEELP